MVTRDRPSRPWLAEVTLGIGHKMAPLRARLGMAECSGAQEGHGVILHSGGSGHGDWSTGRQETGWVMGKRIGAWEIGVLRSLLQGTEGWGSSLNLGWGSLGPQALGTGLPLQLPGRYLRAEDSQGAGGPEVPGAFRASHTGADGRAKAQARAEGACWAGPAALPGGATWVRRSKFTSSVPVLEYPLLRTGPFPRLACSRTPALEWSLAQNFSMR